MSKVPAEEERTLATRRHDMEVHSKKRKDFIDLSTESPTRKLELRLNFLVRIVYYFSLPFVIHVPLPSLLHSPSSYSGPSSTGCSLGESRSNSRKRPKEL